MQNVFDINGLVFWSEEEIRLRETFRDYFARTIQNDLLALNPQWKFHFVEAPLLNPRDLLNVNYTAQDIWEQESFVSVEEQAAIQAGTSPAPRHLALRPETTPGSYAYAQYLLNNQLSVFPPLCVWQAGKSFRREIVQPTKHMRLKEFYQQEFQCIYTADTALDYQEEILEKVRRMIGSMIHLPTRLVESDRLPAYSLRTMDVEVWNGDKWMEVCSISKRTDFPQKLTFQGKKGQLEKDALVLEIAIGLDRCVYNWQQAQRQDIDRVPPVDWREEVEAIAETEGQPT
jgi:glycyl-tRNA synthetase